MMKVPMSCILALKNRDQKLAKGTHNDLSTQNYSGGFQTADMAAN